MAINTHHSLVKKESNVIIRNLGVKKVLADNGDAIGVRELKLPSCLFYTTFSTNTSRYAEYSNKFWIDHCDVSSDMDYDKDYYDGLIDVSVL